MVGKTRMPTAAPPTNSVPKPTGDADWAPDDYQRPKGRSPQPKQWRRRRWLFGALGVIALATVILAVINNQTSQPPPSPTPATERSAGQTTARGRIEPISQARIGSLGGGVVARLSVVVGQRVGEADEVARIRSADGQIEVVTAPWAGTVTAVPVNRGDTILPGALLARLGDLSQLRIETTDVDEFLIGRLMVGQPVSFTVDALGSERWDGVIERITLQPERSSAGDDHYPVIIMLIGPTDQLRPGMTVRLRLNP